jgi:hypothetical protein
MRYVVRLLSILIVPGALLTSAAMAASPRAPQATVSLPATNAPDFGWTADDGHLVYTLDNPLQFPPGALCACTVPPFADFNVRFFDLQLHATAGGLTASKPHLFFTARRGLHVELFSDVRGWVIYQAFPAAKQPDAPGPWALVAHNLSTRKEVVLDSSDAEGIPSLGAVAASDGRSVAWSTSTRGGQSVVRTYDLVTAKQRLVARGGSPTTWSYVSAQVSGHRVVFVREAHVYQQIMLADLQTAKMRALTSTTGWSSEPTVSGDVVAWKDGLRFGTGKGVVIYNLRTGARQEVRSAGAETPRATAGRYILFTSNDPQTEGARQIHLYDVRTGANQMLFQPGQGWNTGTILRLGGHTAAYLEAKSSSQAGHNLVRVVVVRLP